MTLKSPNYRDGEEMSVGRGGPAGEGGGRSPPGVAGGRCSDGAVYILTLLVVTWVYKCDEPTQKHTRTPVYQC